MYRHSNSEKVAANGHLRLRLSKPCSSPIPISPGAQNQFNAGPQQKLNGYIVFDAGYFWNYTHKAYDFDVLFNTPIPSHRMHIFRLNCLG